MTNQELIQIILGCSGLTPTQRWIVVYAARQSNTLTFRARFRLQDAAEFAGVTRQTVSSNLRRLRKIRLFKKVRPSGRARANTYRVNLTILLPKEGR